MGKNYKLQRNNDAKHLKGGVGGCDGSPANQKSLMINCIHWTECSKEYHIKRKLYHHPSSPVWHLECKKGWYIKWRKKAEGL